MSRYPRNLAVSTPEQEARFRSLWLSGAHLKGMCAEFSCATQTIVATAKRLGLRMRLHADDRSVAQTFRLSPKQQTWLRERARLKRLTIAQYLRLLIDADINKDTSR